MMLVQNFNLIGGASNLLESLQNYFLHRPSMKMSFNRYCDVIIDSRALEPGAYFAQPIDFYIPC